MGAEGPQLFSHVNNWNHGNTSLHHLQVQVQRYLSPTGQFVVQQQERRDIKNLPTALHKNEMLSQGGQGELVDGEQARKLCAQR